MDLRCLLDCLYSKTDLEAYDLVSISLNMKGVPFVFLVGVLAWVSFWSNFGVCLCGIFRILEWVLLEVRYG